MKKLPAPPKLFAALKTYSRHTFAADLLAGIIVGIVALPLAIAFGIASGVSPEKGLITAILGGFLVSLLGGSSIQIGGPTGAFIVIVAGIIQAFGIQGLAIATVMAGFILILMGCLRLGTVIRFIPYPIVVGFTSGIALTIFSTQIKDLCGLSLTSLPPDFFSKWIAYAHAIDTLNLPSLAVGIASILIIRLSPRLFPKVPGSLLAILLATLAVFLLRHFAGITSIETIGDRFSIHAALPLPQPLHFNLATIQLLLPAAFTISFLAAIESLLSATVADGVTGDQHDSNTELIAQGAANLIVPLFGGIPVTGAIARTMTNINNGGRTPVAGIIHAAVLLLILLFLSPLTKHIPMACLAAVLIIVAYNMSEWRTFRSLLKNPKGDVAVLLITFSLTVIFDLTIAIEIGLLLAMLIFMQRVAESTAISVSHDTSLPADTSLSADTPKNVDWPSPQEENLVIPPRVEVYEIDGPFFFGIASKFDNVMKTIHSKPLVRIIRMRKVPFMDSTGLHNLESLLRLSQAEHTHVILSGVNPKVRRLLLASGFDQKIGADNICPHIQQALHRARLFLPQ
jgi:SulP family sulfate permease